MRFANPTSLQLGAAGTLLGWRVRVVGRVVMGMDDAGETYFWNEFNLVDDAGTSATLVYEDIERGPPWKLFTTFTPRHPITIAEAATKRVGEVVNLDGTPAKVTLVDQSRVYHIEGTPPEGMRVGSVANYFNAEERDRMLVASWTGDEIEFYEGRELRPVDVTAAFNLPTVSRRAAKRGAVIAKRGIPSRYIMLVGLVLAGLLVVSVFAWSSRRKPLTPPPPPPKRVAPPLRLPTGGQGMLNGHRYIIKGQAVLETGRVGMRHDRREYFLRALNGEEALLIQGLNGAPNEWHLFVPIATPVEFSSLPPYDAGGTRRGTTVNVPGASMPILQLFQTKRLAVEGELPSAALPPVQYGFLARRDHDWLIARWTESAIQFHRGTMIPEAEVLNAFGPEVSFR